MLLFIVQEGDISQCMIFGDYYNDISTPFMVVTSFEDTSSEVLEIIKSYFIY